MLAVTGINTTIVQALGPMIDEEIIRYDETCDKVCSRFLLCAGVLHGKRMVDQSHNEIMESVHVNLLAPILMCERILEENEHARICIIGSQSAANGSFDTTYAVSKAGVHAYVKWRKIGSMQQIVCIAPTIISDSGMTKRRHDYPEVLTTRKTVTSVQVAKVVKKVLYDNDASEFTNMIMNVG